MSTDTSVHAKICALRADLANTLPEHDAAILVGAIVNERGMVIEPSAGVVWQDANGAADRAKPTIASSAIRVTFGRIQRVFRWSLAEKSTRIAGWHRHRRW